MSISKGTDKLLSKLDSDNNKAAISKDVCMFDKKYNSSRYDKKKPVIKKLKNEDRFKSYIEGNPEV